MVEHSQIAHRALLIGEDDGWFEWKGDAESGGWHASLHNDLIKIRDNQHIYSWVRLYNGTMDALKKENEKLKAENEKMHTVSVELFNSRSKCLKYIEELEEKLGMEIAE